MQLLCARDGRFNMSPHVASGGALTASPVVHPAKGATLTATPLVSQASRQASPALVKGATSRIMSSGGQGYPRAVPTPQCVPRTSQLSAPQLPKAEPQRAPTRAAPARSASTGNGKFGAQGPAPLPWQWYEEYEVALEAPVLGGGAFAEVFKVRHRRTQQHFAVKVMHRPNFTLRGIEKQIEMEIRAMSLATQEAQATGEDNFIVRLIDQVEEGEYVFLLLELCEQGDLLRKLYQQPNQRFAEACAFVWARQLLEGLGMIHRLGVIHRDIKPDNLLCTDKGTLRIADFGWCCEVSEAPTALAGTFQYMAPEVLQNLPQTEKADVWCAGVTLYQLLVGKPLLNTYLGPGATNLSARDPHEATATKQRWLVEEINSTCPPSPDLCPKEISPLCWDFLRRLLVPDVRARSSVAEALKHPWLQPPTRSQSGLSAAGSVSISNANAAAVPPTLEEARESDGEQSDPEPTGDEAVLRMVSVPADSAEPETSPVENAAEVEKLSPVVASPLRVTTGADGRTPLSEVESIENVPTPLNPRSWDPNRNMAYSPPCKDSSKAIDGNEAASEAAPRSPERSPEQGSSPVRRLHESPERATEETGGVMPASKPTSPTVEVRPHLQASPGRDLEMTPRVPDLACERRNWACDQVLPPPSAIRPPPGSVAMAALRAARCDDGSRVRQTSPFHAVAGRQTPMPPMSPMPSPPQIKLDSRQLVAAPMHRMSPPAGGRSLSPPNGIGRSRGLSFGSPGCLGGRRTMGGAPPAISAPRLRLSAPGDLLGATAPTAAMSTGAIPCMGGSTGLVNSPPHPNAGEALTAGTWKMRPRTEHTDAYTLLKELQNTNNDMKQAVLNVIRNRKSVGNAPQASSALDRLGQRSDGVQSTGMMDRSMHAERHGAASVPVAPQVHEELHAMANITSCYDDMCANVPDFLSATMPASRFGGASPGVLAPILSARENQPARGREPAAGRTSTAGLALQSARDRNNENYAPPNQESAWVGSAKMPMSKTPLMKPRQAGSVQVRQGSMPRYGYCPSGQAANSHGQIDTLSQTCAPTMCRTPMVPQTWTRAVSPDMRRCTLGQLQAQQALKAQALVQSPALPPPRLVAQACGSGSTSLPQRLAATPVPAPVGPVWAYPTPGYRAGEDRRRASVPGPAYCARAS